MRKRILVLTVQPVFEGKEGKSVPVNHLYDSIPEADYRERYRCEQVYISSLTGMFGEGQPHCRRTPCLDLRDKKLKKL